MASIQGSSSGFGDTSFTKVFVGGLAWETQSEMMRQYFEQFGDIVEAVVINDNNTGRSKGYGFVTFRDPESAAKACVDPAPVIDGRRANCNLASLGRPRPTFPFVSGHVASQIPYVGGGQTGNVPSIGSYGYQQPFFYNYRQGFLYSSYPNGMYGPEYVYPQGVYNPYSSQQYLQMYGAVNTSIYPYNQMGQMTSSGHGYTGFQGHTLPGQFKQHFPLAVLQHMFKDNNLLFRFLHPRLCQVAVLTAWQDEFLIKSRVNLPMNFRLQQD
ncbi:hypothetical protein QVD17_07997 [Tagetes erecta]|uniref:RRM domain-containing protein n=1 Tax=Tagetes erecta TaxID=13708 RepID=A0AAD8P4C9_TARER|nr:hypothetical protein QVD17_07997 [Tagetes erecta]